MFPYPRIAALTICAAVMGLVLGLHRDSALPELDVCCLDSFLPARLHFFFFWALHLDIVRPALDEPFLANREAALEHLRLVGFFLAAFFLPAFFLPVRRLAAFFLPAFFAGLAAGRRLAAFFLPVRRLAAFFLLVFF